MNNTEKLMDEMGEKLGGLKWDCNFTGEDHIEGKIYQPCKCPTCGTISGNAWYAYPKNITEYVDCGHEVGGTPQVA